MTYSTLQYLTEAANDKKITVQQAVAWIKQHCPRLGELWLDDSNRYYLRRGVNSDDIRIVDAPKRGRSAANASDFYRAMHDEVNANFPARGRSMSLTNDRFVASNYGEVAWVFVPDNAQVAVLDSGDFWGLDTLKWTEAFSSVAFLCTQVVAEARSEADTPERESLFNQFRDVQAAFDRPAGSGNRKPTSVASWVRQVDRLLEAYRNMIKDREMVTILERKLSNHPRDPEFDAVYKAIADDTTATGQTIIDSMKQHYEYGSRVKMVSAVAAASTKPTTHLGNEMWTQSVHLIIPDHYERELAKALEK